jgi:hypothetical protein
LRIGWRRSRLNPILPKEVAVTNQKWDFESWWSKRQAERRQEEKKRLNATCPVCGGDLLDVLVGVAYDESRMPSGIEIECPQCRSEIEFSLEWETVIDKATIKEVRTNDRR